MKPSPYQDQDKTKTKPRPMSRSIPRSRPTLDHDQEYPQFNDKDQHQDKDLTKIKFMNKTNTEKNTFPMPERDYTRLS